MFRRAKQDKHNATSYLEQSSEIKHIIPLGLYICGLRLALDESYYWRRDETHEHWYGGHNGN